MRIGPETRGVYAISATPFLPDGALDLTSLDRLVDFYEGAGVDGLTILGILGEAPKLTGDEAQAVVARVLSRAKVPVVVGVSSPGLAAMRELALRAMDLGAAGVMVAPPHTARTDDQIASYFAQAAQALGPTPICVQDHPQATGVQMSVAVLRRIFAENPTTVMLKAEDWPGLEKISALRGERISILCGNGGIFLDMELARGADGAMTGYAFPDMLADLVRLSRIDRAAAQDLFDTHLPLMRYEQQPGVGLAVRKHLLVRRGAMAHDTQRTPASAMTPAARAEVDWLLHRLARHDPRAAI